MQEAFHPLGCFLNIFSNFLDISDIKTYIAGDLRGSPAPPRTWLALRPWSAKRLRPIALTTRTTPMPRPYRPGMQHSQRTSQRLEAVRLNYLFYRVGIKSLNPLIGRTEAAARGKDKRRPECGRQKHVGHTHTRTKIARARMVIWQRHR